MISTAVAPFFKKKFTEVVISMRTNFYETNIYSKFQGFREKCVALGGFPSSQLSILDHFFWKTPKTPSKAFTSSKPSILDHFWAKDSKNDFFQ